MLSVSKIFSELTAEAKGLEWVSPQENTWVEHVARRLDSKYLCSTASQRWPCVYAGAGGGKWCLSASLFPQHALKLEQTELPSICPRWHANSWQLPLCCLSLGCCLFKGRNQLACWVLSQLIFQVWAASPTVLQNYEIQPIWFSKQVVTGICLLHVGSLVLSPFCAHSSLPPMGSSWLHFALCNLSDAALLYVWLWSLFC